MKNNRMETTLVDACPVCDSSDRAEIAATPYADFMFGEEYVVHALQCTQCGFVYQAPRMSDATLSAYYAAHDTYFDFSQLDSSSPALKRFESIEQFVRRAVDLPARPLLLDVGTYFGQFPAYMQDKGWNVAGIDVHARTEEIGKKRGFPMRHATLDDLKGSSGRYDLIALNHTLEHLSDFSVLEIAGSLLSPGGHLFVEVPNVEDMPPQCIGYFTPEHLSYFAPRTLTRLLARWGFSLVALECRKGGVSDIELGAILAVFAPTHSVALPAHEQERILGILKSLDGTPVHLWGSGAHAKLLMGMHPLNLAGIIDSSPERQGKTLFDVNISSPDDVQPECVVVSSYGSEREIARAAKERYPHARIVTLYGA